MNRTIFFFLLLLLVACQSETATNSPAANAAQPAAPANTTAAASGSKIVKASALAPLIGSWEAIMVLNLKNSEDHKYYEGMWFDLNGDQTFAFGQYEEQTHTGTYTFDDESSIIEFVFNPRGQKIASQYKLQGIGYQGTSTLIWLGNTPKNPDGMQIKMDKFNRKK